MCDCLVRLGDDGVMFAKNSDRDPNEAQVLEWVPAADHPTGSRLSCTWIDVPQSPHTHAVLVSRPWWMWGAEIGANQHHVVIGNEAIFTRGDGGERALLGMDLVRLGLERAASAEEAVSVMVELLERHGQGGPCSHERPGFSYDNSFLVADPRGAFVLETVGRRWAVEPVRGPGRSISNRLTIPGFARTGVDHYHTWRASASARRASTERTARSASGPSDLMGALACHGAGPGPGPRWSRIHGGLGAPCVHAGGILTSSQTTASWVSDLRFRPGHWATATSAPCLSLFKPVDVGQPVDLGPAPTDRFDARCTWWRHEPLHRRTLVDYGRLSPLFRSQRDHVQAAWIDDPPASAVAFAQADRLERDWMAAAAAAHPLDARPLWVRRSWQASDRSAGLAPAGRPADASR